MIRNLKALGLALVAVFAMSAIAATAAQAEETGDFWAAEPNSTIDMVGHTNQIFVSPTAGTLVCTEVDGHAILESEGDTLTGTDIEYRNCHATKLGLSFPVTIDMNGCHFTFTIETYEEPVGTPDGIGEGSFHIENCAQNNSITITMFKNSNHSPTNDKCQVHVPEQTVEGVTYHNTITEDVMAMTIEFDEVDLTETVTDTNQLGCNEHVHDDVRHTASFWAKATNGDEDYIDTTVTGTPNP